MNRPSARRRAAGWAVSLLIGTAMWLVLLAGVWAWWRK